MNAMKLLGLCAIAGASLAIITPTSSAVAATREAAIKKCIAVAQTQVPSSNDQDAVQQQRMSIYSSCMKSAGYRP